MPLHTDKFLGAKRPNEHEQGVPALSADIFHLVGNNAHFVEKPADKSGLSVLCIRVEKGSFRIRPGEAPTDFVTTTPVASNLASGEGGLLLKDTDTLVHRFGAPDSFTAVGSSGTDVLTFWWQ